MSGSGPAASEARLARRWIAGLVVALSAWGLYLAVGATGIFVDVGLFDLRKSFVVLGCTAAFLLSWLVILRARARRPQTPAEASRNWPSTLSLLCALLGVGLWIVARRTGQPDRWLTSTYVWGWLAAASLGISAVLAMIGASDPRARRGRGLALVSLLLLLLAASFFVWQLRQYTRSRAVPQTSHAHPEGAASDRLQETRSASEGVRCGCRPRPDPFAGVSGFQAERQTVLGRLYDVPLRARNRRLDVNHEPT